MEKASRWLLLVVGAGVLVAVVAWEIVRGPVRIDPRNQVAVERGRDIYMARCASCHGADLEGQPNWQQPLADGSYPAPPQNASGHTWHHTDTELFVTVRDGDDPGMAGKASVMPAFGKTLGDSDIVAVLAFIKSNWPPDVLSAQERLSEETRHAHH